MDEHDLGRLAALVEHRLDAHERSAVIAHLADCRECRAIVASLARATTEAALQTRRSPAWTRPVVWLPIAASALIVTGAGWLFFGRAGRPPITLTPATSPPSPGSNPPGAAPAVGPASAPPTIPSPSAEPGLTRRSGEREVASRRFRLEAGTWVDAAYDPFKLLPVVDVRTAAERDALVSRLPALRPFLTLGPRFTLVLDGTVYRFDLPR